MNIPIADSELEVDVDELFKFNPISELDNNPSPINPDGENAVSATTNQENTNPPSNNPSVLESESIIENEEPFNVSFQPITNNSSLFSESEEYSYSEEEV